MAIVVINTEYEIGYRVLVAVISFTIILPIKVWVK